MTVCQPNGEQSERGKGGSIVTAAGQVREAGKQRPNHALKEEPLKVCGLTE